MHLTYITIDSINEGVGQSQILPLIKILKSKGVNVTLISFEKNHINKEVITTLDSLGIEWIYAKFSQRNVLSPVSRLYQLIQQIGETDIIHARGDIPAIAALLSRKAPVLWDMRGLWSEQRMIITDSRLKRILFRILILFRRIILNQVDALTTLTYSLDNYLINKYGNKPSIRDTVTTVVDLDHFEVHKNLPKKLRIVFSGSYNNYYDLNLTRDFISLIRKRVEIDVVWFKPTESTRENLGLEEEIIMETTYSEMPRLLNEFSIGVAICKNLSTPNLGVMPTKIGEFLACGRPVVVNRGLGDLDTLLKEYKAGVVLDCTNLDAAVEEVIELTQSEYVQLNCRKLAIDYFDLRKGALKYLDIYKLISRRGLE